MQTTNNTSRTLKKLFGAVVVGAFALAPIASVVVPAQAAPTSNERRQYQTLEGVVTSDGQGRDFVLRQNNGRRIQVRSNEREPRRLTTGDRVRVVGFFRRNQPEIFRAETVYILTNQNNNTSRSFTGRVTTVESNERFDIVVGNTTYNVFASTRLPRRLNRGDMVRVFGRRSGDNDIINATVVILNDNNNNNTFTGRVSDIESDQRFDLVVDGTTYNVMTSTRLPRGLDEGDRVRVYGRRSAGNDIINATVVILDEDNNDNSRTFTGRVSAVDSNQRFDLVIDGTTYNVMTSSRLPRGLDEGDRVRVTGRRSAGNDIINATVVILDNNDDDDNDDDFRTFTGRVSDVESDQRFDLVVDGTTYNVTTAARLPRGLDEGDRVRVYGRRSGDNDITDATVSVVNDR